MELGMESLTGVCCKVKVENKELDARLCTGPSTVYSSNAANLPQLYSSDVCDLHSSKSYRRFALAGSEMRCAELKRLTIFIWASAREVSPVVL